MILIISQRHNDYTTDLVVDWVSKYTSNYVRINGFDLLTNSNYYYDLNDFIFGDEKINLNEVSIVWYRRWADSGFFPQEYIPIKGTCDFDDVIPYIKEELRGIKDFFIESLSDKFWLHRPSSLRKRQTTKAFQLKTATKCGLKIPKTLITGSKKYLLSFLEKLEQPKIIIKNISEVGAFKRKSKNALPVVTYTKNLTLNEINTLPEYFTPILVQEKVIKEFEIRIFHFDGINYAMAIFSQLDDSTAVDFRNYSPKQRMVPFKLPKALDEKITFYMEEIGLETGSIDLLYSTNKNYYFLEVNPEGQFGMVSLPCNYYIEKKMAQKLSDYVKQKN